LHTLVREQGGRSKEGSTSGKDRRCPNGRLSEIYKSRDQKGQTIKSKHGPEKKTDPLKGVEKGKGFEGIPLFEWMIEK